ncbi:hypothetical protein AVEN_194877-1 [Araneus ventricosus]|uniref:Uncharacterized protein n=1 Tax=Araneus ventricosus TaxID=182803 RepID=A0A4Y2B3R2_ARAVE|nr:hypothetical protein AVEN_194877-1 [Araneus ventricosus]
MDGGPSASVIRHRPKISTNKQAKVTDWLECGKMDGGPSASVICHRQKISANKQAKVTDWLECDKMDGGFEILRDEMKLFPV